MLPLELEGGPISAGPQPPEKGVGGAWRQRLQSLAPSRLGLPAPAGLGSFPQPAACSPGHGLPSPLSSHPTFRCTLRQQHGMWGSREPETPAHIKTRRYCTATIIPTQRDNTGPDEAEAHTHTTHTHPGSRGDPRSRSRASETVTRS